MVRRPSLFVRDRFWFGKTIFEQMLEYTRKEFISWHTSDRISAVKLSPRHLVLAIVIASFGHGVRHSLNPLLRALFLRKWYKQ